MPLLPQTQYRLTASNLARYFKHGCDRLFRWEVVSGHGRFRLAHDPTVAPSTPDVV